MYFYTSTGVVQLIINKNRLLIGKINKHNRNALNIATKYGKKDVMKLLIQNGGTYRYNSSNEKTYFNSADIAIKKYGNI